MATVGVVICAIIFAILSQHVVQAKKELVTMDILSSRPNSSSSETVKYCLFYFKAITKLPTDGESVQYYPVSNATEWNVCDVSEPPPQGVDIKDRFVFISDKNNCSVLDQASRVQSNGGVGTLIPILYGELGLNDTRTNFNLTLGFVFYSTYTDIMSAGDEVTVALYSPQQSYLTPESMIFLMMMLFAVGVGSYWSGKVRYKLYLSERESTVRVEEEAGQDGMIFLHKPFILLTLPILIGIMVMMVVFIVLLYFFMREMVYVVIAIFFIFFIMSIFSCLHPIVSLIPSGNCRTPYFNLYLVRGTVGLPEILLLLIAVGLPVVWLVMRKEDWVWVLLNILFIAFTIAFLKTFGLTNLKDLTIFLLFMVLVDIFLMLITPLMTPDHDSILRFFSHENKEVVPVVLDVPGFGLEIDEACFFKTHGRGIHIADLVVPGVMVAYAFFIDLKLGTPYYLYYIINIIGYGVGGHLCLIVSMATDYGSHPCFPYLLPCTLFPTLLLALIHGNFKAVWFGDSDKCCFRTCVSRSSSLPLTRSPAGSQEGSGNEGRDAEAEEDRV